MSIDLIIKKIAKQQFLAKREQVIKNTIMKSEYKIDQDILKICLDNATSKL